MAAIVLDQEQSEQKKTGWQGQRQREKLASSYRYQHEPGKGNEREQRTCELPETPAEPRLTIRMQVAHQLARIYGWGARPGSAAGPYVSTSLIQWRIDHFVNATEARHVLVFF